LERLEARTLLTLAPAASGELAAAFPGSGYLYTCPLDFGQGLLAPSAVPSALPAAIAQSSGTLNVPARHSDPQATAKLFLDFDGHWEADWDGWLNVRTPAFDQDGDPAAFGSSELAAIDEIWARVAGWR
jgi:hypothetical protein